MKKRKSLLVAIICTLAIALLALTACTFFTGASDGRFPYDAAKEQGFDGSEDSFLASLENPSTLYRRLYEEAVGMGYEGTYFDFLKELGIENGNGAGVQKALRSIVSVECAFPSRTSIAYSRGSGVIYSLDTSKGDALIVTNYHVVYSTYGSRTATVPYVSDDIHVYLYGSLTDSAASDAITATYLGGSMDYDIAVLKVEGSSVLRATENHPVYALPVVACDSDSVTVGEQVYAIGNAAWEGMTVTEGIVSVAVDYIYVAAANDEDVIYLPEIRTSAAINQGNSGGGLFNVDGELIGIVNARSEADGVVGMGFAIPVNIAFSLAQNIIDTCAVSPQSHGAAAARLGISIQSQDPHGVYNEQTGKYYVSEKIVVTDVQRNGAAYKAGMAVGDTLLTAKLTSTKNGSPFIREVVFTNAHKLDSILFDVRKGDRLELTVSREGQTLTLSIVYSENSDFMLFD